MENVLACLFLKLIFWIEIRHGMHPRLQVWGVRGVKNFRRVFAGRELDIFILVPPQIFILVPPDPPKFGLFGGRDTFVGGGGHIIVK